MQHRLVPFFIFTCGMGCAGAAAGACVAMRFIMLQCVAVCYSVVQCVAVCCSVLQCVAVCVAVCGVLQCVMQSVAVCCAECIYFLESGEA